jgi:hypothetical protein
MQNLTTSYTSKLERTLPGFQWSVTRPQTINALGVTISDYDGVAKTVFLDRLQRQKKN